MARVKVGVTAHRRHKHILKLAKGYYGSRSKQFKKANELVMKALSYARRDRRAKKREYRRLWIARINAATQPFHLRPDQSWHRNEPQSYG
mgnify:CR=1 FL=1